MSDARMFRMGYRQHALLHALRNHGGTLPTGYLLRTTGIDPKTAHVALRGLSARGLVSHVGHGNWEAAA